MSECEAGGVLWWVGQDAPLPNSSLASVQPQRREAAQRADQGLCLSLRSSPLIQAKLSPASGPSALNLRASGWLLAVILVFTWFPFPALPLLVPQGTSLKS